jgi:tight adherence protein B
MNCDLEAVRKPRRKFAKGFINDNPTDFIAPLSTISRSLRSGSSLRQAISDSGSSKSSGIIYLVAQELSSGRSLDEICSDLRINTGQDSGGDHILVLHVIELAHSMGGNEARLIDSLLDTLIERRQIHNERLAQAATALSSMRLLTWLPLVSGMWMMAESPSSRAFLLHTTFGHICLIVGIFLNSIGRLWAKKIVGSKR